MDPASAPTPPTPAASGWSRRVGLWLGPVLAALAGGVCLSRGLGAPAAWTAAITVLCATWWVTEPIPIPATSLVPFALFPLTGVLDHKEVAKAYGDTLILLLMGGFVLSTAIERSGAHRRLAVGMVRLVGGRGGKRLVLGFMLASAVCSMWISNTATTLMMLPIAIAVLDGDDAPPGLATPLLLGVAWASSIGGLGTPVGTPPNLIFMAVYKETTGVEWSFVDWMRVGVPVVMVMVPIAWFVLTRRLEGGDRPFRLPTPGAWTSAERRTLAVFAVTIAAWVFRGVPFGGWSGWLGMTGVSDSTVALTAVVVLFLVRDDRGEPLLDWESASRIPWGLLLLFGGGIALAKGFEKTGLSAALGQWMTDDLGVARWPEIAMIGAICLVVTFLTEVTSNTATTTLLMPVLAAAAVGAGIDPTRLMIPAAVSASCAFMLPVATAPNAVVYGSGRVPPQAMARLGLGLNLLGTVALTLLLVALL